MSFAVGLLVGLVVGSLVTDFLWAKYTGNLDKVVSLLRQRFGR